MRARRAVLMPVAVVGGALLLALLVLVATSGPVSVMTERPRGPVSSSAAQAPEQPSQAAPTSAPPQKEPEPDSGVTEVLLTILKTLLVVGSVVLLVVLANLFARSRTRSRARPAEPPIEPLPDVADTVRRHAGDHLDALLQGRPRNAIVACWLRLESSVAEAGLPRLRSETSAEYTTRILSTFSVDSAAIGDLAALYREARFSTHELGEGDRQRAVDDLQRLYDALGAVAR